MSPLSPPLKGRSLSVDGKQAGFLKALQSDGRFEFLSPRLFVCRDDKAPHDPHALRAIEMFLDRTCSGAYLVSEEEGLRDWKEV